MEVALGLLQIVADHRHGISFNPCFRGSRPRTIASPRKRAGSPVSILVFVEVALGHLINEIIGAAGSSFNPCFRGSRPRTIFSAPFFPTVTCFNPCFRGSRPRTPLQLLSVLGVDEFQSLFSWKSPSDVFSHSGHRAWTEVSILVFVEVALGRYGGGLLMPKYEGFNPCFRGSRPRT